MTRGGAVAARRAHNPKVPGSSPGPATNKKRQHRFCLKSLALPNSTEIIGPPTGNVERFLAMLRFYSREKLKDLRWIL